MYFFRVYICGPREQVWGRGSEVLVTANPSVFSRLSRRQCSLSLLVTDPAADWLLARIRLTLKGCQGHLPSDHIPQATGIMIYTCSAFSFINNFEVKIKSSAIIGKLF